MSTTMTPEALAILWVAAASQRSTDPFPDGVAVEPFVELLREHKLSSTALRRCHPTIPTSVSRAVEELGTETEAHAIAIQRDIRTLDAELVDFADRFGPVVYLKGHSAQLHTRGCHRTHRPTTDIDLLASDPEALQAELMRLGYRSGKPGISHELSALHHDERVDIDLHRYFPSWSYPMGVNGQSNGPSTQLARVRTSRVSYEMLAQSSIVHPDAPAGNVRLTGLEETTLLTALHAFKDYVEASFTHGRRKITLLEVLEFGELLSAPDFDEPRFRALTDATAGNDAVDFVHEMLRQLRAPETTGFRRSFPREIARGVLSEGREPLGTLVQMRSFYRQLSTERPTDTWPLLSSDGLALTDDHGTALRCWPDHPSAQTAHEVTLRWSTGEPVLSVRCRAAVSSLRYFVHVALGFADRYEKISLDLVNDDVILTKNGVASSGTLHADETGWTATFTLDTSARPIDEPVVVHSYQFLQPIDDDWNHLYDDALVSTSIPCWLSTSPAAGGDG